MSEIGQQLNCGANRIKQHTFENTIITLGGMYETLGDASILVQVSKIFGVVSIISHGQQNVC